LYWFEVLIFAEKLTLAVTTVWLRDSPCWAQLQVGFVVSGGRLALHLVFAPLTRSGADGEK
jgi:hypothetical protein